MAKRKETIGIENALDKMCREKRIYGCEEVTIGFHNNGYGNEIVDFMHMDSKGIIKCYEIKVTFNDLKSDAKKSWYGHYNYLVVSDDLYKKVSDWSVFVPDHVSIISAHLKKNGTYTLMSRTKAKKQNISFEMEMMLKESLVRSMYYKMLKYKDSADMDKQRLQNSKIHELERRCDQENKQRLVLQSLIFQYERACRKISGKRVFFEDVVKDKLKAAGIDPELYS